jgi:hypothetical protein
MSTEDLNKLLQEDMELNQDESDMDLIVKVLEVLEERETGNSDSDMEAALDQLHNRIGLYERMFAGIDDTDTTDNALPKTAQTRRYWYRFVGVAAAIVLLIVIGISSASAMGYDLWGGVVHWTEEMFSFGEKQPAFSADERYHELENTLAEHDIIIPVLPKWLPEQYTIEETMVVEDPDLLRIVAMAYANGNSMIIQVIDYNGVSTGNRIFEIDGDSVKKHEAHGVTHYYMTNDDSLQIVWAREHYQVQMDFSDSSIDAQRIIDSIYKEK